MPRLPLLSLLLIALLAVPSASAGWWWEDEPVTIEVAELRIGDRLLLASDMNYREETDDPEFTPETKRARETVVHVEGYARAVDGYGIERETVSYLAEESEDGVVVSRVRMHCLRGTDEAVRTDVLFGSGYAGESSGRSSLGGVTLYEVSMQMAEQPRAIFDSGPCSPRPSATTYRAGDMATLAELTGDARMDAANVSSAPAVETTFHGRDALAFTFDAGDIERANGGERGIAGTIRVTLADGLPGIVAWQQAATWDRGYHYSNATILGFEPGTGEPVATGAPQMPERHPSATFATDPQTLDDAALELSFPFARALETATLDPTGELPAWLAAHPDAVVAYAYFLADMEMGTSREDQWVIYWDDGGETFLVIVSEMHGVSTPLGPLDLPARVPSPTSFTAEGTSSGSDAAFPEGGVLSSEGVVEAMRREGVEPGTIRGLFYFSFGGEAWLYLDQLGMAGGEGRQISFDADAGRLSYVGDHTAQVEESGVLALKPGASGLDGARGERSAMSALVGPVDTLALPAAAATSLALLLLVAKFLLVPLFTRLRRDRLLDNPVRARLYERVRAEPGIHRAELVDFAGIGEGATRHHLQQMVAHRLLYALEETGFVRYYAAGEVPPEIARREAALRAGSQRRVYDLLAARPELSLREAGAILGMSAPSVHRAKRKLEKAGLLPAAPAASVAEA